MSFRSVFHTSPFDFCHTARRRSGLRGFRTSRKQVRQTIVRLSERALREARGAGSARLGGSAETYRIDHQAKAEIALLRLKEAAGIQPDEILRLKGSLEQPKMSVDQNQLLQIALAHLPDLAAQRANEAIAAAELRQQQAEAKPDATVSASYERPNSGFSQRPVDAAGNLSPLP